MLTIVVCVGSSCFVRGSEKLAERLERLIATRGIEAQVELTGSYCMDRCSMGVSVRMGDRVFGGVQPDQVEAFFEEEIMPRVGPGVAS